MLFNETLNKVIAFDLSIGLTPALMGDPGIGKSSFVKGLAQTLNTKAFVITCNLLADKADLTGARLVPTEDGTGFVQTFVPHYKAKEAVDYALANPRETPILFLDEINRTNQDITSGILTMVTERVLGNLEFPPNLRLMVSGNTKGDIIPLDEASISRFSMYQVAPDAPTLLAILEKKGTLHRHVKKVLSENPDWVFERSRPDTLAVDGAIDDDDDNAQASFNDLFDSGEEMLQITTPRTIEAVNDFLNAIEAKSLAQAQQIYGEWLTTPSQREDRDTHLLAEILETKTGNTRFTAGIIGEITNEIQTGMNNSVSQSIITEPNVYVRLQKANTIDELNEMLEDITDKEKAESLVYAIYERKDNKALINSLAAVTPEIEQNLRTRFITSVSSGDIDDENLQTFLAAQGDIVDKMTPVITSIYQP